jgi:hypothetical protein
MSCLDSKRPLKVSNQCYPIQPWQSYDGQCCHLSAELSDQFGGKIWPLRKMKIYDHPDNVHCFKGSYALEEKIIFVNINEKTETYNIS